MTDLLPIPPVPCRGSDLKTADILAAMVVREHNGIGDLGIGHALVDVGWPVKVVSYRLERMDDQGLICYGVSLFTPWITDAGRDRIGPNGWPVLGPHPD